MLRPSLLLVLAAGALYLTACDGTEPEPPTPSSFIRGSYIGNWVTRVSGPGTGRETITTSRLIARLVETSGDVSLLAGAPGTFDVTITQVNNNGDVVNRQLYGAEIRAVSGTYDRATSDFSIRLQGSRSDTEFDVTFTGRASFTYTQLTGRLVGEFTRIDAGSGNRVVVHTVDNAVTLELE